MKLKNIYLRIMIGTAKLFTFIFILISKNYFVCSTPYKWNLTNSVQNVQLFGQFIDGIDKTYDQELPGLVDEKRKLLFFYTIFVKYASEIANFWMINSNAEDACANLKVGVGAIAFKFLGDGLRYDKAMEQNIANEFNKNILCPEEQLPRAVVDQLLMLTFSFAVRLLMSIVFGYFPSIGEWQMKTLLSAYKILSTKSDANGIFPFKIIQCSADISHWSWTESEYTAEHKQYIQNFKFVLKLSDFSLTSFEVHKLLETIIIDVETMDNKSNVQAVQQQPPTLYTFVKQYFVEKLEKRTLKHFWPTSNNKLLRRELLDFGAELHVRAEFNYYQLRDDSDVKWDEFKNFYNFDLDMRNNNTLELFGESLTNYTSAIQIDVDKCKGVTQFAEALRKIVVDEMDSDKNNDYSNINGLVTSNEFQFLLQILNYNQSDNENFEKLKHFEENFERKMAFSKDTLNQFLALLDQIIGEYSYSTACKFKWNLWCPFEENIPRFGQLFFAALQKYSGKVKYDGKDQLMSFPSKLAEHFLQRVYMTLTESKSTSICQIGEELDFVETMQNVASTEQFEFVKRKKIIPIAVNAQLFKLLFSLAFRLSLQIERSDLVEKYLKAFGTAYNCIDLKGIKNHSFFQFKINISHEIVQINLPNWKLPDYMQKENINELRQQKVKKTFDFLLSLSNCATTFYEILKVAKKLGEIELPKGDAIGEMYNDDHQNWLFLSNSKIIFEIMKYLKPLHKRSKQIKIDLENEFCFLAHFVEYLLEKMATGNKIPNIESIEVAIGHFILVKEELCSEKSLENFVQKYFDENLANFDKAINLNIDFSPHNELRQIVRAIVEEIEQILKNDNWNFAHLNFTKIVEWNLLEYDLHKIGNAQKWDEIEHLRAESQNAYSNWYSKKNEEEKFSYKEMKKLIKVLRRI